MKQGSEAPYSTAQRHIARKKAVVLICISRWRKRLFQTRFRSSIHFWNRAMRMSHILDCKNQMNGHISSCVRENTSNLFI
jgi:hypothetical protein